MRDRRHLFSTSIVVLFAGMAVATTKSQQGSSTSSSTPKPSQARPSIAAPEADVTTAVPKSRNKGHNLLAGASERERNFMLATAVQTAGDACREGRRNFFQGFDQDGNATWNVECNGGKAFAVMVYNDAQGSTKVLECSVMKAIKVDCFKKF